MRKFLHLIIYITFLLTSCDVHEFPEEVLLTKEYFTITLDFDTDMQEQDYYQGKVSSQILAEPIIKADFLNQ